MAAERQKASLFLGFKQTYF